MRRRWLFVLVGALSACRALVGFDDYPTHGNPDATSPFDAGRDGSEPSDAIVGDAVAIEASLPDGGDTPISLVGWQRKTTTPGYLACDGGRIGVQLWGGGGGDSVDKNFFGGGGGYSRAFWNARGDIAYSIGGAGQNALSDAIGATGGHATFVVDFGANVLVLAGGGGGACSFQNAGAGGGDPAENGFGSSGGGGATTSTGGSAGPGESFGDPGACWQGSVGAPGAGASSQTYGGGGGGEGYCGGGGGGGGTISSVDICGGGGGGSGYFGPHDDGGTTPLILGGLTEKGYGNKPARATDLATTDAGMVGYAGNEGALFWRCDPIN